MNEDDTREQKLSTIERRFQFVLILALLAPVISPNIIKIFPTMVDKLGSDGAIYSGTLLTYVLLDYFLFEMFRRMIQSKSLSWIDTSLFILSFVLVAVTGLAANYNVTITSWWQSLLLSLMMLAATILPFALGIVIIWNPAVQCIKKIRSKLKTK